MEFNMNRKTVSLLLATLLLTACGGGSSSQKNDGKGEIDLAEYFPKTSMTKTFSSIERDGDSVLKSHNDEIIEVLGNTIITTVDTQVIERVVITDTNITTTDMDGDVDRIFRHVDLGDTILSGSLNESEEIELGKMTKSLKSSCVVKSKEDKFEKDDNVYSGDLLKIECITEGTILMDVKPSLIPYVSEDLNGSHDYYDKSYLYLKKGLGEVASINDDCIISDKLSEELVDDRKSGKECDDKKHYAYEFYLP